MNVFDHNKTTTISSEELSSEHALLRGLSNALMQFLSSDDSNMALGAAFKALRDVIHFDGIYLIEFTRKKENKVGLYLLYSLDEFLESKKGDPTTKYFEFDLKGTIHEKNIALLEKGQAVYANLEDYDEKVIQILSAAKVLEFSVLPVKVDDQLWGGLAFVTREKREPWNKEEARVLELFSHTLGNFIARKGVEKALKESEQRFDMVIEGSKLGSWVWEISTNHIRFNDYWAQMLGYDPLDLEPVLETFTKLVHPDDAGNLWENINHHMAGGSELFEVEFRMKTKEGKWRWILDRGRIVEWSDNGLPIRAYGTHVDITEKKINELKLRESEALFRSMYENSPLGIAYTNTKGNILQANDKYCKLIGYSHEELIGENFRTFTHPEDADRQKTATLKNYQAGKHSFQLEKRYIHKDGHVVWANVATAYLHDEQGDVQAIITIVEDITEKKEKLDALVEREALLNSLFENSSLGIVIRDNEGKVIRVNKRHCEMLGYSATEMAGLSHDVYTHPDTVKKGRSLIEAAIEGKETLVLMESRYFKSDGSIIWANVSISLIYDEEGNFANLIIMAEDISEQYLALKALKQSEALQKATLSALPDLKLRIKEDGEVLEYYPSKEEEAFSLPKANCVGENLVEIYPEFISRGILHNARQAIQTREVRSFEYVMPEKNGLLYYEARISAINDQEVIAMIRNISERKKMQQSLQENIRELDINNKELQKYIDSNMELENFAYIASHDLREPVRTMRTFAQLLKKKHGDNLDESAKTYIDFIVAGSSSMNQLIEDLLTYSRVNTDKHILETIDPDELIKEVLDGLGDTIQESGVDIHVSNLPAKIMANPTKLKQVFQNLISNAIKFRTSEVKPEIEIYTKDLDSYWQFTVDDNGIGIDPEFHDRIFLLFKKLHSKKEYQGTGLGLAICKKIVEQHQGNIWVESLPDEGATFNFTIKKEPA